MGRLQGKSVLVTGGSSGIGLATARLFHAEGARLAITGRDQRKLDAVQEELGSETLVMQSEAGDLNQIDAVLEQVKARFGRLDILVINAGIATVCPIEQVSEAQFDQTMGVNFKGAFFTIQKALPLFGDSGAVIAMTSITNRKASPNLSVYGASKAALRSLVQSLSVTLIRRGIRINAICPGPIDTPIYDRFGLSDEAARTTRRDIQHRAPTQRFGTPEEVARLALFLASEESSYMVGEEIVVDGGISLL